MNCEKALDLMKLEREFLAGEVSQWHRKKLIDEIQFLIDEKCFDEVESLEKGLKEVKKRSDIGRFILVMGGLFFLGGYTIDKDEKAYIKQLAKTYHDKHSIFHRCQYSSFVKDALKPFYDDYDEEEEDLFELN